MFNVLVLAYVYKLSVNSKKVPELLNIVATVQKDVKPLRPCLGGNVD